MNLKIFLTFAVLSIPVPAKAQGDPSDIAPILSAPIQSAEVATFQLQQFLLRKAPTLTIPPNKERWAEEAHRLQRRLLKDTLFHGWPDDWVNSPPKFTDFGQLPSGPGYTIHKLQYEVVPGLYSTALLYEPEHISGKLPAVLNVMGHFFDQGNAVEFQQKFCINQALKGMVVLNPGWMGTGELNVDGNEHWFGAHLDLVGMNGAGLFYLAMQRGLDYLSANPMVDLSRIGVTGLSGGGWQTIVLSSLDPRVQVSIPVAGFTTLAGRVERFKGDVGDIEQNATDFLDGQDYSTLTALRAPRPTLLIYNAEDDCCFRAPLVKEEVYDPLQPFFELYGKPENLQFYQNTTISAHNYGLDDRERAYQFLMQHFRLPGVATEAPVGQFVKDFADLRVGVPQNNLTILGLARQIASGLNQPTAPTNPDQKAAWAQSRRAWLQTLVRYHPVTVLNSWPQTNTYHNQVESISYRFELNNELGATGVWLKDVNTQENAPLTIVLNDRGKVSAATQLWNHVPEVADRMERGEQVLALDLLFTGDAAPDEPQLFTQMLAATGERPLGMEAAQLIAIAKWAQAKWKPNSIRLESTGIRTQIISLVAAALQTNSFSEVVNYGGMPSLSYLLQKPVPYQAAPDLFCLDLYKDFDVNTLEALASPATVSMHNPIEKF